MVKISKPKEETAAVVKEENTIPSPVTKTLSVTLPHSVSVRQLSEQLGVSSVNIIKQLMRRGIMANINQALDYEMASEIAKDLGFDIVWPPRQRSANWPLSVFPGPFYRPA